MGQSYLLGCPEGGEPQLLEAVGKVDAAMCKIRDHTVAAAYSVRGFPDGRVSTPISWDEIDSVDPHDFTIATVPRRYAELGDLHAGIDLTSFDITPLLEWADQDASDGAEPAH